MYIILGAQFWSSYTFLIYLDVVGIQNAVTPTLWLHDPNALHAYQQKLPLHPLRLHKRNFSLQSSVSHSPNAPRIQLTGIICTLSQSQIPSLEYTSSFNTLTTSSLDSACLPRVNQHSSSSRKRKHHSSNPEPFSRFLSPPKLLSTAIPHRERR